MEVSPADRVTVVRNTLREQTSVDKGVEESVKLGKSQVCAEKADTFTQMRPRLSREHWAAYRRLKRQSFRFP